MGLNNTYMTEEILYRKITHNEWVERIKDTLDMSERDIDEISSITLPFYMDINYNTDKSIVLDSISYHSEFLRIKVSGDDNMILWSFIIALHPDEYFTVWTGSFQSRSQSYHLCDTIDGVKQYLKTYEYKIISRD